jgi:hypothetical protein
MMEENKMLKFFENPKGFIALLAILIVFLISLSVGLGLISGSIYEATMGFKKFQSSRVYYLTNLCAEEVLMRLKENINYPGNEEIEVEGGNCQILPIEGNWKIKVIGNFQNQTKKMKIVISQVHPRMVIESWEEVSEF